MILLNFAHPLTTEHLSVIAELGDGAITVRDIPVQFDLREPFAPQVRALVEACGLSAAEWQTRALLINLPSLNTIAAALLAELHGRAGYFPPVLQMRPVEGPVRQYEVGEILDLQGLREQARGRRTQSVDDE